MGWPRGGRGVALVGVLLALGICALWYYGLDRRSDRRETAFRPAGRDGTPAEPPPISRRAQRDLDADRIEVPQGKSAESAEGAAGFTIRTVDPDGNPIAGLRLDVRLETTNLRAETDANGVAILTSEQRVTEVVFLSSSRVHIVPPPRAVGPREREITLVLERSGRASGTIVAPDGTPLRESAGIDVRRNGQTLVSTFAKPDGAFRAYVPANGTFDLVLNGKVRPSDDSNVESYAEEQFFHSGKLAGVTAGQKDLILEANPVTFDRSLIVRVLGPDGQPLKGVNILAAPMRTGRGILYLPTGPDGSVEFSELPSRPVVIQYGGLFRQAGFAPPENPIRRVVPSGQTVEFRLRATTIVSGIASFADGAPARGAQVTAWAKMAELVGMARCDENGRFEIRIPVDAERVVIGASCRVRSTRYGAHARVKSAADRVTLELSPRR